MKTTIKEVQEGIIGKPPLKRLRIQHSKRFLNDIASDICKCLFYPQVFADKDVHSELVNLGLAHPKQIESHYFYRDWLPSPERSRALEFIHIFNDLLAPQLKNVFRLQDAHSALDKFIFDELLTPQISETKDNLLTVLEDSPKFYSFSQLRALTDPQTVKQTELGKMIREAVDDSPFTMDEVHRHFKELLAGSVGGLIQRFDFDSEVEINFFTNAKHIKHRHLDKLQSSRLFLEDLNRVKPKNRERVRQAIKVRLDGGSNSIPGFPRRHDGVITFLFNKQETSFFLDQQELKTVQDAFEQAWKSADTNLVYFYPDDILGDNGSVRYGFRFNGKIYFAFVCFEARSVDATCNERGKVLTLFPYCGYRHEVPLFIKSEFQSNLDQWEKGSSIELVERLCREDDPLLLNRHIHRRRN